MKKVKIYFWKYGFQETGESLWVVQCGRKKWFARKVEILIPCETKFSRNNPHAYIEIDYRGRDFLYDFQGWVCNSSTKTCHYKKISIL